MTNFYPYIWSISIWFLMVAPVALEDKLLIVGGYRPKDPTVLEAYTVSIRREEKIYGSAHSCGGTILTQTAVLTAAHCLYRSSLRRKVSRRSLFVVTGSRNRVVKEDRAKTHEIALVVVHERYRGNQHENDIGILRTKTNIKLVPGIAELVPLAKVLPNTPAPCTAIGWGRMFMSGPMPNELLYTDLMLFNDFPCLSAYRGYIAETMLCAGTAVADTADSCQGDSGGPLFADGKQIGIVSFGFLCGTGIPAVYTDVTKYLDWISRNCAVVLQFNRIPVILMVLVLNVIS